MRPYVILNVLWLCACGATESGGHGELALGWRFLDGRRCAESGVQFVVLSRPGKYDPLAQAACTEGLERPGLSVSLPAGDQPLQLTGLSAEDTPLYRGTVTLEVVGGAITEWIVPLAFIGGL